MERLWKWVKSFHCLWNNRIRSNFVYVLVYLLLQAQDHGISLSCNGILGSWPLHTARFNMVLWSVHKKWAGPWTSSLAKFQRTITIDIMLQPSLQSSVLFLQGLYMVTVKCTDYCATLRISWGPDHYSLVVTVTFQAPRVPSSSKKRLWALIAQHGPFTYLWVHQNWTEAINSGQSALSSLSSGNRCHWRYEDNKHHDHHH